MYQGPCNSVTQPARVTQSSTGRLTRAAYTTKLNSPQPAGSTLPTVTHYEDAVMAHGWLAGQQDPQVLLCSWPMQLLFQKIHIFPLLHEDPLFTFFRTAAQTPSVCIGQFSLSYIICKLAELVNSAPLSRTLMKMFYSRTSSPEPWGTLFSFLQMAFVPLITSLPSCA